MALPLFDWEMGRAVAADRIGHRTWVISSPSVGSMPESRPMSAHLVRFLANACQMATEKAPLGRRMVAARLTYRYLGVGIDHVLPQIGGGLSGIAPGDPSITRTAHDLLRQMTSI